MAPRISSAQVMQGAPCKERLIRCRKLNSPSDGTSPETVSID